MKGIFFFIISFSFKSLFAQSVDSVRILYANNTIYRFGGSFLKGNEKLGFRDLANEFSVSDLGLISYKQSVKYRKLNKLFSGLSILTNLVTLSIVVNKGNRNVALGVATLQFGFILTARRYQSLSNSSLDRALWQRNMDVLYPNGK